VRVGREGHIKIVASNCCSAPQCSRAGNAAGHLKLLNMSQWYSVQAATRATTPDCLPACLPAVTHIVSYEAAPLGHIPHQQEVLDQGQGGDEQGEVKEPNLHKDQTLRGERAKVPNKVDRSAIVSWSQLDEISYAANMCRTTQAKLIRSFFITHPPPHLWL
jgi:hypothetical protein